MPLLRSPNGAVVDVPEEQIGNYVGYSPVEGDEASRAIASPESPDRGVLGGVNAAATGLLSGATLGLSDYALKGILNQGQFERLAAEREEHPFASGAGQVAGAILPAIAAPESLLGKLPSGIVGHATADAVTAGRAIGGAEGIGRALAAGGIEGAIQNAGMYLSDTALGDRELSAEGLAASLGPGFAFGVGGGVAALGIEQGTIAARRLFSRAAGTDKAAEAAQSAWSTQYQSTLEANDAAADIARAKLAEARAAREQAQLAKQQAEAAKAEVKLRPMPADGTARAAVTTEPPPVPQPVEVAGLLHDRAMAAMDPAKLAAWDAANGPRLAELMRSSAMSPITLEEAATATARPGGIDWDAIEQSAAMTPEQRALQDRALLSKAQEEELAAAVAEHDAARADLDDILRRIDLPDVAPGLVEAPGFKVPPAEWGPPGMRGYDPGNVPAPGPPSVVEAATGDVTAVGKKKLAQGTPATPSVPEQPSALEDLARMQREAGEPPTALEGLVDAQRAAGQTTKAGAAPELRPVELQPLPKEQRYKPSAMLNKSEQQPIAVPRDLPGLNTGSFEDRFITAFNALDDLAGKHNSVALSDIRAALPDVSREQFDAGLRELRKSKKYSLDAFETRNVMPHKDIVEGGLKEQGENLMLVQQRDTDGGRLLPSWAKKTEAPSIADRADELPPVKQRRDFVWDAEDGSTPDLSPELPSNDQFKQLNSDEYDAKRLAFRKQLTKDEIDASTAYAGTTNFREINKALRKGAAGESERFWIKGLDDLLEQKGALPEATRLYRGLGLEGGADEARKLWSTIRPGDEFVDNAFGSTTASFRYADDIGKVTLAIDVPKGYQAAPLPSMVGGDEAEYVLRRATKYRVLGMYDQGNGKILAHVEVVPSEVPAIRPLARGEKAPDVASPIVITRRAAEPSATDTLTGQLGAMQSKLGSGAELGKLSKESPAAAEYATKKLAKREADAAYFRERAKGGKGASTEAPSGLEGLVSAQRLASKDVAADDFFANLTRPKTRDAYVAQNIGRAWKEEGSHAAALAKVEREWAEMSGAPQKAQPATWREFTASKMSEYMKSEGSHGAAMKRMSREWAEMAGHPASTKAIPDAVEDVAAVAQAATKYEKASARLTEALGPDAPPAAQKAAKAFRDAEGHAERKTMERTTRAIDDHAEAQAARPDVVVTRKTAAAPVPTTPNAPDWLDEAKRLSGKVEFTPEQRALRNKQFREWEMNAAKSDVQRADAKLTKAKVAETEAKISARNAKSFAEQAREAAMKARPVAGEAGPTSTLGAIATTIGVAGELGVPGIPHPHDIPIIGPLLGTYLKYRAIKAAAGRFVGRIPATGDARAAALVARTKDKIATAVDRTLGLAEAAAPKARGALVATAAVLGHRLIDDGEPDAPKNANAQQQAAVRIREIANAATQPGLVTALVRKELRGVTDPDLIAAAEQHLIDRFQKLNNVMPKAPPPNPYSKREWVPSPAAAHEVAQRLAVVHDPEAAFHDTTPAKAETLRDTWPRLLQFAQQRLIERVGDLKHPVPYENRLRNSLLFSVPLDDSMQPDHAAILQSANAPTQPAQPPAGAGAPMPSIAGNSNLTALYQTASDRRAMR